MTESDGVAFVMRELGVVKDDLVVLQNKVSDLVCSFIPITWSTTVKSGIMPREFYIGADALFTRFDNSVRLTITAHIIQEDIVSYGMSVVRANGAGLLVIRTMPHNVRDWYKTLYWALIEAGYPAMAG